MKNWLIVIQILLLPIISFGQSVTFTGSAPQVVQTGEQFRLVYQVNADCNSPQISMPDGIDILSGPNVSQSSSFQFINGHQTNSFTKTFTYIISANKVGNITIPAAKVSVKGNVVTSNTVHIEVIKGQASSGTSGGAGGNTRSSEKIKNAKGDMFVRVILNRNNIYQGEHVVATLKLYTRLNISGFDNVKFPPFSGFFNQEIETPSQISLKRENVNGKIFQTGIIKKYVLFPQRSGKIIIDPFEVTSIVRKRVRSNDPFNDFFGGSFKSSKVKAVSPKVSVNVKALPQPQPKSFTGAVGNFKLETSVDKTKLKTNESLTLRVKIIGDGNLKLIEVPKIVFPTDFEVYDPKVKPSIRITQGGAVGSIVYEYLVIPRHKGTYSLNPVKFSYFNPVIKKYKTLSGQKFIIKVEQGDDTESNVVVSNFSKQDVSNIGSDIRYIKINNLKLREKNDFFIWSSLFYLIYILGIGFTVIILLVRRKKIKENADLLRMRTKKASKVSKKRLKHALQLLKSSSINEMYEAILHSVWGYLGDKLTLDAAELTRDNVGDILENKNIDTTVIDKLIKLIDDCEFARYAPAESDLSPKEVYNRADEIISLLDKNIK